MAEQCSHPEAGWSCIVRHMCVFLLPEVENVCAHKHGNICHYTV